MAHRSPQPAAEKLRRTTSSGGGSGSIILERYRLGRMLGRGSFAKVYLGTSLENGDSVVAIKVIDKGSAIGAVMESVITREVSAMRRLQHHPNILKLHEVMATKSKIYLVMELAEGGELFSKLYRLRRFTEPAARRYFQQVISALRFCHQNGIAHRDIKPQNLLLDRNGTVKITDFGLSALPEQKRDGLLHTACGTPAYSAPEVAHRKGYDGEKADAWSCGVLLYVFLVGRLPFDDSNLPQMYKAMYRRAFDIPDGVSKSAKNLIQRLMDPNPDTRLSLGDVMKHSWFKKSFSLPNLTSDSQSYLESEVSSPRTPTAFDIISLSSGLNLSGLFENDEFMKEMKFTSVQRVCDIKEKVMQAGGELGYRTQMDKRGEIRMVNGGVHLAMEIWEMSVELCFVELKFNGCGVDFQRDEMKRKLDGIALSWVN